MRDAARRRGVIQGVVTFLLGGLDEAQRLSEEGLLIFRDIGDSQGMDFALHILGMHDHHANCYLKNHYPDRSSSSGNGALVRRAGPAM